MRTLAFELGCEEMPARFVDQAADGLLGAARETLAELRLPPEEPLAHATPRRLVLLARIPREQEDLLQQARGPAERVAFDAEGRPTRAAAGFARSQGLDVDHLTVRETEQGRYVFAERRVPGEPAERVLPAALAALPERIAFPRAMRWGDGERRFIRPVRWLLALLDDEPLPVRYGELESEPRTRGHRTLAPGPHPVPAAAELPGVLEQAYVLADRRRRRERVRRLVEARAREAGGEAVIEEDLLTEVTHLVEWPTAFAGAFAAEYLQLPAELLVTTMRVHQRYFPVRGGDGRLTARFVAVRNGGEHGLDTVRAGNEKVLRARLADAKFFFDEDRKQPLEAFVEALDHVTFIEGLGSLRDKTGRLERLVGRLADRLDAERPDRSAALRAARLAKADQATRLVYELPELEGVMGREYARHAGEPEAVAAALEEQYLPRPGSERLPATRAGTLLAVADRLDTLAGAFLAGIEPTGSHDPYGLRRQVSALLTLCRGAGLDLSLHEVLTDALAGYDEGAGQALERLAEFCRGRLENQLREAGYRHDLVEAVVAAGWQRVPRAWARAEAGRRLLQSDVFADVYTAFRRAHNLARSLEGDAEADPALFAHEAEGRLREALAQTVPAAREHLQRGDYGAFYRTVAALREPVDAFLDDVLVMSDDEAIRTNRLALLQAVAEITAAPLDLSRLAV